MQMTCTECGKVGNEDDLCELGEPCPDAHEGCDGLMVTWQPLATTRHPVDELPQLNFDAAAREALESLIENGHSFTDLSPGDATRYRIVVVAHPLYTDDAWWVASNFGGLAKVPNMSLHWDYVSSHMLSREHEWTARVITRFLNTLRYLKESA